MLKVKILASHKRTFANVYRISLLHLSMKKSLILVAFFALFYSSYAQPAFSLEDITIHRRFEPNELKGLNFIDEHSWITLEHVQVERPFSQVLLNRVHREQKEVLLNTELLAAVVSDNDLRVNSYQLLDKSAFLVSRKSESIYRRSSKAFYYYIDVSAGKVIDLFPGEKQMYPALAPDRSKIAYVVRNDLYYTDLQSGKIVRLTYDGRMNHIINGAADWVYEEEFDLTTAFRWSPDSRQIAYLKFDESAVKEFGMDLYYGNYPERTTFKYPRAGEQNSKVSVWLLDVKKRKPVRVPVEAEYIPRIKWRSDGQLGIMTLPRFQNELTIHLYHPANQSLSTLYSEVDKRYIDLPTCFEFMPDGELAISSEKSGFNQLYILDLSGQELYATSGDFDIAAVKQINMTDKTAYLQIFGPRPENKSVLKWNLESGAHHFITETNGIADARILANGAYVEDYSSQEVRKRIVMKNQISGAQRTLLEDYRANDSILGHKHFFSIPMEGYDLRAWMIKPPNFDSCNAYPVIFYVYGGPGSLTVQNSFPKSYNLWLHYMSQLGYIIVSVENRGTMGRGASFKKATYTRIGQLEIEDQFAAAEFIGALPFADAERMSIFGWSYGGYMSLLSLMQGKKIFKAAISVAPVTNWRFYDSVYSERYLRTPVANPAGYDRMSPNKLVNQMEGELLLVHGSADDNVHFQNSMELLKVLNEAGKRYTFLPYPNKDHGIGGAKTRLHLFTEMTDFLERRMK
jgi:dipeptidyl-peptidase 4